MGDSDKDAEKAAEGEDLLFSGQVKPYEKAKRKVCCCVCSKKTIIIISIILAMLFLYALGLGIGLAIGLNKSDEESPKKEAEVVEENVPVGAVVSDHEACSKVGRDVLERGGTAVDAAIATLLCNGVRTPHSMGIGGGCYMVVYDKSAEKSVFFDGREMAPHMMNKDLYKKMSDEMGCFMVVYDRSEQKSQIFDGSAIVSHSMTVTKYNQLTDLNINARRIAVPGELKAYKMAHNKYGRLPWKELFQPAIAMIEEGFPMAHSTSKALNDTVAILKNKYKLNLTAFPLLCELFCANTTTGEVKVEGDIIMWPKLAETYKGIADMGPKYLYANTVTHDIVKEIQEIGGVLDVEDFMFNYKVEVGDALRVDLGDYTLFTMGGATGGPVVGLILNILQGYGLTKDDISTVSRRAETYHKIIEAMKFAYADRNLLADPAFENVTDIIEKMVTEEYASLLRSKITSKTHEPSYYSDITGEYEDSPGTSQVSVLSPYGDAVSVTSTINYYFGSLEVSNSTGIIWNNEMDDFSSKPKDPSAPHINFVEPGKRPRSSMVPAIITDKKGRVKMVIGAAGGTKITTAVAQIIAKLLFLDESLEDAIREKRFHQMLDDKNQLHLEKGFPEELKTLLNQTYGHEVVEMGRNSVVETILVKDRKGVECVQGYADKRKLPGGTAYVYKGS